jgi:Rps23 Pro-64 3,4-dihydroxylase Tpa1-like proline 4-hydroxylase
MGDSISFHDVHIAILRRFYHNYRSMLLLLLTTKTIRHFRGGKLQLYFGTSVVKRLTADRALIFEIIALT